MVGLKSEILGFIAENFIVDFVGELMDHPVPSGIQNTKYLQSFSKSFSHRERQANKHHHDS